MDKKRKWHLALILSVIALTVYNILPTLFYYSKPLKNPISSTQAESIGQEIVSRVDRLEVEALDWIGSYCELIQVKPQSITLDREIPDQITITFAKTEEAARLRSNLPRAGSLIPFVPAQISAFPTSSNPKEVIIQRRIPFNLSKESPHLFSYIPKYEGSELSADYKGLVQERVEAIQESLSRKKLFTLASLKTPEQLLTAASAIQTIAKLYDHHQEIAVRFAQSQSTEESADQLISAFERLRDIFKEQKGKEGTSPEQAQAFEAHSTKLVSAESFVKKHKPLFSPLKASRNPFFQDISVNWDKNNVQLTFYPDVQSALKKSEIKEVLEQLLIDQVAAISNDTDEQVLQIEQGYSIPLQKMDQTSGFLVLKLDLLAKKQAESIVRLLKTQWHPTHPDLAQLQIVTAEEYESLSPADQTLCLVVAAPAATKVAKKPNLSNQSIYVLAKGIDRVLKGYEQTDSSLSQLFIRDFRTLSELLARRGFTGYTHQESNDYIFENRNFYTGLIAASREEFYVPGGKRQAILELSNVEQRILTLNKIETSIHEDLIRWNDEYRSAQVSLNHSLRFDVPKPTKNLFLSNVELSLKKLFRGDERKILRWGLDLSGGKTVEIELRDQNNKVVKEDSDIKQGINELFNRVNKMGVSDVSIRKVGHHIVLDFPGGQALSATDLVKASSMYFHIVNEKFATSNPTLGDSVNRFLQEVWNEAIVTNRKDPESVHAIAYRHLHGDGENRKARSEAGRNLFEEGLRLANPQDFQSAQTLDDSISKIVLLRGENYTDWHGQPHPLMIVFQHHALEGAQLDNVRASYDPSKGNFLSFEIKGASPRANLHAWTSQYSKENVLGSAREDFSRGRGWRMAVLLNDTVISAPTLESALRDSASITGSFSQREVNQLVSDLKAGSLTFTPHILSEKNVSPELGQNDRMQGIIATGAALLLVVGSMIGYYRFAGLVASIAVLFNLLILWATLQNLGASLSLAGIAGIILTVGMAVDANVLVFERIKEEFASTGRIASAIHAGYEKAFSAILDSNVTTIIAALILLNFDAGPIKAFAVSMIIGIASSMFTALFMTRFYFNGWLQNPKNKALKMASWIHTTGFDFLKYARISFAAALAVIVIGGGFLFLQRSTIFGMDFTGGYALHIELDAATANDPVVQVEQALQHAGAAPRDFQIRAHDPATHLRLLLGTSMEQPGKPFYGLPLEIETNPGAPAYQKNPRINWVVNALEHSGLRVTSASLATLETNWTSMSGQMSESMRNNALIGLLIAFVSIFVYIAFRFEYKYAISAILCLLHDVLITLGLIGLLHAFKVPIQIDLNTVAALMTIIGYSLNDTIIIFDRIREDVSHSRKLPISQIINRALNSTLSRTAITSGTTLLVLLALVLLGGSSIFSFSLVMVIGVVFGTLSSWFIAAPLLLFFHRKEEAKEEWVQIT